MKIQFYFFLFIAIIFSFPLLGQEHQYQYSPSSEHPYGLPNPEAPPQIRDFEPTMGTCDCISERRNRDGSWQEKVSMKWTFSYIMNGWGVQDATLKEDGKHAGSIRLFNVDSLKWYVYNYASTNASPNLSTWEGNRKDNSIVLYKDQMSPHGMSGFSRLTFYDFSQTGYKWIGEWVSKDESIVYPFWKIECTRDEKKTLKDLMTGSFNSQLQAGLDSSYYDISLHMVPIWKDRDGSWLYVEQALTSIQNKPYRQRIYQIKEISEDSFESVVYAIENEDQFIGIWKNPDFFNKFNNSLLKIKEGCTVYLQRDNKGHYKGSTHAQDCKSSLRGAAYATSEVIIADGKILSWDRGFDENGIQMWGAEKGGYEF